MTSFQALRDGLAKSDTTYRRFRIISNCCFSSILMYNTVWFLPAIESKRDVLLNQNCPCQF